MIILSPQHIHMQRHARILRPTTQPMRHHLCVQTANHRRLKPQGSWGFKGGADEVGARGDVEDGAREGFVERAVGMGKAGEGGAGAEGGGEGGAESEEGVFGCVVIVDFGGAGGAVSGG